MITYNNKLMIQIYSKKQTIIINTFTIIGDTKETKHKRDDRRHRS